MLPVCMQDRRLSLINNAIRLSFKAPPWWNFQAEIFKLKYWVLSTWRKIDSIWIRLTNNWVLLTWRLYCIFRLYFGELCKGKDWFCINIRISLSFNTQLWQTIHEQRLIQFLMRFTNNWGLSTLGIYWVFRLYFGQLSNTKDWILTTLGLEWFWRLTKWKDW